MSKDRHSECLNEDQLVADCPQCGYSLRGLPAGERPCPECGCTVDRRWEIFGGRGLQAALRAGRLSAPWRWLALVPVIYTSVAVITSFMAPGPKPRLGDFGLTLLIALAVATMAWPRPKGFIAIGPCGLVVGRRKGTQAYSWNHIARAQYSLRNKCIEFEYDGECARIPVQPIFGLVVGEVDRCVQAINAHPRIVAP